MHHTLLLCCRVTPVLRLRLYPPVLAAAHAARELLGLCPLSDYVPLMDALGLAVKLKWKTLLPEVSLHNLCKLEGTCRRHGSCSLLLA